MLDPAKPLTINLRPRTLDELERLAHLRRQTVDQCIEGLVDVAYARACAGAALHDTTNVRVSSLSSSVSRDIARAAQPTKRTPLMATVQAAAKSGGAS